MLSSIVLVLAEATGSMVAYMPRSPDELELAIIAYVRHKIIGLENTKVTPLAKKIGVSKAWVTDVRVGKMQTIGPRAVQKLVNVYFGGSVDKLQQTARAFAADHPELLQSPKSQENSQPDGVIFRLWIDRDLVVTLTDSRGKAARGKMQDFSDSMRNAVIASVHMLGYSFEQITGTAREVIADIRAKGHSLDSYDDPATLVEMIRKKLIGKPSSGTYPSSSLRLPTAHGEAVDLRPKPTKKAPTMPPESSSAEK